MRVFLVGLRWWLFAYSRGFCSVCSYASVTCGCMLSCVSCILCTGVESAQPLLPCASHGGYQVFGSLLHLLVGHSVRLPLLPAAGCTCHMGICGCKFAWLHGKVCRRARLFCKEHRGPSRVPRGFSCSARRGSRGCMIAWLCSIFCIIISGGLTPVFSS